MAPYPDIDIQFDHFTDMSSMDSTLNNSNNLDTFGVAAALGLCIMFGSNAIAIKLSLTGLGVYFTAGIRFLIASVCLIAWAAVTGQKLIVSRQNLMPLLIISAGFSLQLLLVYTGLSKTTASRSSLITNLQPFFVLFLAHFFIPGDRINLKKMLGITLAFAGLGFVFLDSSVASNDVKTGDLIVLAGALVWGCNAVYTKHIIDRYQALQVTLYPMVISIPVSFTASLLMDDQVIRFIDARIIGSLLYQSLIAAAIGYIAWNTLLKKYGAVSLHSFVFVMPITGVLLGGLVLDEPITSRLLIGMVLVVIGLLVIHLKQKTVRPLITISRNV